MSTSAISHPANDPAAWILIEGTAVGACEYSQRFANFLSSLLSGVRASTLAHGDAKTAEIAEDGSQERIAEVGVNDDEEMVELEDENAGGKLGALIVVVPQFLPELALTNARVSGGSLKGTEGPAILNEAPETLHSMSLRETRFPEQSFESRVIPESITKCNLSSEIGSEVNSYRANAMVAGKSLESAGRPEQATGEAMRLGQTKAQTAPSSQSGKESTEPHLSVGPFSIETTAAEALLAQQLLPASVATGDRELRAITESTELSKHATEHQELKTSDQVRVLVQSASEELTGNPRASRFEQARPTKAPEVFSSVSFASEAVFRSAASQDEPRAKRPEALEREVRSMVAPESRVMPMPRNVAHDLQIDVRTELGKVHIRAAIDSDDRVNAVIEADHRAVGTMLADHAPLLERALADRQILLGTLSIKDGAASSGSGQGSTNQPHSQGHSANHFVMPSSGPASLTEEQECSALEEGRLSIRV
jgi:hypothetical protein